MASELGSVPDYQAFCSALFDALVVAETYCKFGPGLSGMPAKEQQTYVVGFAAILYQDLGFADAEDLMPAVRRWVARERNFPTVAELAQDLEHVRQDRRAQWLIEQQLRNAGAPELPVSGLVGAELRAAAKDRLAKAFEEATAAKPPVPVGVGERPEGQDG